MAQPARPPMMLDICPPCVGNYAASASAHEGRKDSAEESQEAGKSGGVINQDIYAGVR